jgi:hypothetical protein
MPRELTAIGFRGMNNLPQPLGVFKDESGKVMPEVIINADATDAGVLLKRQGLALAVGLSNAHSLWARTPMLCVADGVQSPVSLWSITQQSKVELCRVEGPRARLSYLEINGLIYLANPYWKGVYDLNKGAARSWGVPLPPAPSVVTCPGDMPPGIYLLCYTQVLDGRLSGNGPLIELRIAGNSRGLQFQNLPANGQVWITHPSGKGKLFLANLQGNTYLAQAPLIQPLPTFGVQPPPGFTHFHWNFGRIWGCLDKKLYYSDEFQYEWFRPKNYLPFTEDLVMVAPANDGLFVNSRTSTWFLAGQEPEKMQLRRVGDGAIPGTLTFALVEGGGYEISRKLSQLPSPVWFARSGIIVGTQTGHLVHLTEARLRTVPRMQGAGLTRVRNGIPQVLFSLWGAPLLEEDASLDFVFKNGRLYVPKPISVIGRGGVIISS